MNPLLEQTKSRVKTVLEQNTLLRRAREQTIDSKHVVCYLANLKLLMAHVPLHLARASHSAARRGNLELAEFFRSKISEEKGHDEWCRRDIETLDDSNRPNDYNLICAGTYKLLGFLSSLVEQEPEKYLGYMFFLEYATVVGGMEFVQLMSQGAGVPQSSMSAITKHVELDGEHADDDLSVIEGLLGRGGAREEEIIQTIETVHAYLNEFMEECAGIDKRIH